MIYFNFDILDGVIKFLVIMIDANHGTNGNFRQIEDIIDARKLLGHYNVYKQSNGINFRHIYSSSTGSPTNKNANVEDTVALNERDATINLKQTDSEITIVRVRCDGINRKNRQNKWDMHDIAIPGDGSHLGESPSLVNLATLVGHNIPCEGEEYLVPLSSWDPFLKSEELHPDLKCCSESNFDGATCSSSVKTDNKNPTKSNINEQEENFVNNEIDLVFRRRSWAGKISKFIRKHCKKSKTLPDQSLNKN